jgi:hypothetical protein
MTDVRWGQGGSAETDTGILEVLVAFVAQGGQLYGARRWEENPLTLTHVRWHGPSGGLLDAFRQPGSTVSSDDVESNVWVQLALTFPSSHPSAAGIDAPWLPLSINPATASQWVHQLRQSVGQRRSRLSTPTRQTFTPGASMPAMDSRPAEVEVNPWHRPYDSAAGHGSFGSYSPYGQDQGSGGVSLDRESSSFVPPTELPQYARDTTNPVGSPLRPLPDDASQWTGKMQRPSLEGTEIAVLPCIEVELPPLLNDRITMDYHRDFARDVAIHFQHAVQQFREVREVRGWMRGERLVLAARFILITSTRTPSHAEMDRVAQMLSDALAERTLPYAYLGFADPGEWMQGRPLPES